MQKNKIDSKTFIDSENTERQLEVIFQTVADALLVQDTSFRCVYANDVAAIQCGLKNAEELKNISMDKVFGNSAFVLDENGNPFDINRLTARRALLGEDPAEEIYYLKDKTTGQMKISRAISRPVRDAEGKPILAVTLFRDITQEKQTQDDMRFLAEASRTITRSLELTQTLKALGDILVPQFADWYGVDLLNDDGLLEVAHATHKDPSKISKALDMRKRFPTDPDDETGIYQVLKTGEPLLMKEIPRELYLNRAQSDEHRKLLEELSISSALVLPLKAQQRTIGVMTLCQSESERKFSEEDQELMLDFAARASLAIDNARLFSKAQSDNAKLNIALGAAKLGVFDWQVSSDKLYWSDRTKEIYEWDEEKALDGIDSYINKLHPEHRPLIEATLENAIAERRDYEFEHKFFMKDGSVRWVQCNGHPYFDSNDKFVGITGTVKDITWKKKAAQNEAKINQLEKIAAQLANQTEPRMIAQTIIEEGLKVINAKAGYLALLKDEALEVIFEHGYTDQSVEISKELELEEESPLMEAIDSKKPVHFRSEIICPLTAGSEVLGVIGIQFTNPEGGTLSLQTYIQILCSYAAQALERAQNFREANEARKKAEEANNAKSIFLANMSHEIRTPMNAILGFTDLLRSKNISEEDKEQYLSRIERNGDQLLHLIDDILDLSRIEANQMTISHDSFSVKKLLKEVYDSLSVLILDKEIETKLDIEENLPDAMVSDYMRVRQILMNLVSNAAKFTDHGEITIRALNDNGQVRIEVQDTGIGMNPSVKNQLFKHFSQGDVSVTRKYGGSGLGLALSRKLTRMLGGDLELIHSETGKGSTFAAFFPLNLETLNPDSENEEPHSSETPAKQEALKGRKILLAEDSSDNRALISIYLKQTGAELTSVDDGIEAVRAVENENFDLILMDIQMPNMDGLQATQLIRTMGYKGPILALTAHALGEEIQKSLNAGCNTHLTKPISQSHLIAEISQSL